MVPANARAAVVEKRMAIDWRLSEGGDVDRLG